MTATGSVNITVLACQISIPNVSLGTHHVGEFASQPFSQSVGFNVSLSNCPTAPIRYQLDPMTSYANQAQSVVNVTGGATGIGIQLLDGAGQNPTPMGSSQALGSGSTSYTLPFKTRYFKTGSTVSGGGADASIGFTLIYQ